MMLDIAVAEENFRERLTSDIGFMRKSDNIAKKLEKVMS